MILPWTISCCSPSHITLAYLDALQINLLVARLVRAVITDVSFQSRRSRNHQDGGFIPETSLARG